MEFDDIIYENYPTYRKVVDSLTDINKLSSNFNLSIGDTVDHILPVSFGFNWRIPPDIMADKRNLRIITLSENASKGYKCDHIPKYIQKYMINKHHRTMKERQMDGIKKAKENGVYIGRKTGTSESVEQFLDKPKNKAVVEYLKLGWKSVDIVKEVNIHINTITKIKKLIGYK